MTEKKDKPVVFYQGEAAFHETAKGETVAVVFDVLNHPILGYERKVHTSQVLHHFKGGFETLNTLYIQLPRKEDKKYDPELMIEDRENS
jgi:hypothetical protein